jgi:death-on-curing protein
VTENFRFLTEEEILYIHNNQINLYGGQAGIRSPELLDSAIHHILTEFKGHRLYNTSFEIASAYIFHICQNHCFIDGNKRTALATGLIFLDFNGIAISDSNEKLYNMMIGITEGKVNKIDIQRILSELSAI